MYLFIRENKNAHVIDNVCALRCFRCLLYVWDHNDVGSGIIGLFRNDT